MKHSIYCNGCTPTKLMFILYLLVLLLSLITLVVDSYTTRIYTKSTYQQRSCPLPNNYVSLVIRQYKDTDDKDLVDTTEQLDSATTTTTITTNNNNNNNNENNSILDNIVSPVLRNVYEQLVEYQKVYGHVNIPLGNEAGRACATLRRLHIQEKLIDTDIQILNAMNFTWHSYEDVYSQQKEYFHDFIIRLKEYAIHNDGNVSPPKKYKDDPELGAWVTGIRRSYTVNDVDKEHIAILNELNFQWDSPRKCGSKFMQQYRTIKERIDSIENTNEGYKERRRYEILMEPNIFAWIKAQQQMVHELSETRKHYMSQIVNTEDWINFGR